MNCLGGDGRDKSGPYRLSYISYNTGNELPGFDSSVTFAGCTNYRVPTSNMYSKTTRKADAACELFTNVNSRSTVLPHPHLPLLLDLLVRRHLSLSRQSRQKRGCISGGNWLTYLY